MVGSPNYRGVSLGYGVELSNRDNDGAYGHVFTDRVKAMGIRDRPIRPGSPWQNGITERLIGTLRRECLDHVVVLGERRLRCVLFDYAAYYNQTRPYRLLQKDTPLRRTIQRIGEVAEIPILGGLHHRYGRILFFRKGEVLPNDLACGIKHLSDHELERVTAAALAEEASW
jgi:hypothetical protein